MNSPDTLIGLLQSLIYAIGLVVFLVVTYQTTRLVEREFFPVITDFHMEYIEHEPDGLVNVTLYFDKKRDCSPNLDQFAWYASKDLNGNIFYDRVHFELPTTKGSISRPIGQNVSENWMIDLDGYKGFANHQKIIFKHTCFGFWNVTTTIELPKLQDREGYISQNAKG